MLFDDVMLSRMHKSVHSLSQSRLPAQFLPPLQSLASCYIIPVRSTQCGIFKFGKKKGLILDWESVFAGTLSQRYIELSEIFRLVYYLLVQ